MIPTWLLIVLVVWWIALPAAGIAWAIHCERRWLAEEDHPPIPPEKPSDSDRSATPLWPVGNPRGVGRRDWPL